MRLRGPQAEEADHARGRGVHSTPEIAREEPVERGGPPEGAAFSDGLGQPALEKILAIGEARLIALFRLGDPEPLLELGHRVLELAGLRSF